MDTRYLPIIAMTWVVVGWVVAFSMRRRGFEFLPWFALGSVLGPLMVPLAIERVRFHHSESSVGGLETRRAVRAVLDEAASGIGLEAVETEILFGRADKALAEYARANAVELIVVGARGRGATEALFGRITSRLFGGCELPALVGPRSAGTEHERYVARTQTALAE